MTSLRILLADDSLEIRQSIDALLQRHGFQIAGQAEDGNEAVRLAQLLDPDVAILDVSMPGLNGIDAARQMRAVCPRTQVILLTVHIEPYWILKAISAGIRGYVAKSEAVDDLARAIGEVTRGGLFFSPKACAVVIDSCAPRTARGAPFTALERST